MENASKALIIAGAILISILIISFGVIILGQGGDVVQNSNMNETEMAAFNQKFTAYEGEKVRGSNVKQLLRTVLQSNANNNDYKVKVSVGTTAGQGTITNDSYFLGTTSNAITNLEKITSGGIYGVKCQYNNGWINSIIISGVTTES